MHSQLIKLNENSKIEEEKKRLLPYKPKLELAEISENDVNSYSFVCVDNNFYSVPEYLVGKRVVVKKYYDQIHIYANNENVCRHERSELCEKEKALRNRNSGDANWHRHLINQYKMSGKSK